MTPSPNSSSRASASCFPPARRRREGRRSRGDASATRKRAHQQIQPFIGVERAKKTQHGFSAKAERSRRGPVRSTRSAKGITVHGIGNDGDLVGRNTTGDYLSAHALANRRHSVRAPKSVGLGEPSRAIAQTRSAISATACRGVLPKRAHLVHHRNCTPPANAKRRQCVEYRRMGMKNVRSQLANQIVETSPEIANYPQLAEPGELCKKAGRPRCAKNPQPAICSRSGPAA
jgi:hypothetical protein